MVRIYEAGNQPFENCEFQNQPKWDVNNSHIYHFNMICNCTIVPYTNNVLGSNVNQG